MNTPSPGQKTPVDHGVQIRFINDLYDTGGGQPGPQPKPKNQTTSKYGVAVRVQGIAGQPYVVLKDGKKGDSYGVQLRTQHPSGYSSLPRRREKAEPGTQGADVGGLQGGALRRAQSHGSLLDRDGDGGTGNEDFQLSQPPPYGRSGSYGNLDGRIGISGEREQVGRVGGREGGLERNMWDGSYKAGLNGSLGSVRSSPSYPDPPQQTNQRQTPVNRLINRFDGGQQRGVPPEQDPRASSPLLTPNPYTSPPSSTHSSLGRSQAAVTKFPEHSANQWTSPGRYAAVETPQATEAQVTPDLLLDQGQSAETSSEEEQVMQTLFNILKHGSNESDVVLKHKVKVIIQKIQNLKPKDRPQEEWMREKRGLEKKMAELQTALQKERRDSVSNSDPALKAELESCLDENLQLTEMLDRKKKELNETQSE